MSRHIWHGADEGGLLLRAVDQPVELLDHDSHWHRIFAAERDRLMRLFPSIIVDIAHIGSTPIEDLRAKPIVDLMAGVRTMDEAIALNDPLCANGYATSSDLNRSLTDRQFFMRHAGGRRTHHLHVVVHDSQGWHKRVAFCRLLRDDADLRHRYSRLKTNLLAHHADDRDAYTEGKSAFIQSALRSHGHA